MTAPDALADARDNLAHERSAVYLYAVLQRAEIGRDAASATFIVGRLLGVSVS